MRWWWRRWPRRHERAATRDGRHTARSPISGRCMRRTLVGAEVRRPLGLRRCLTLIRDWRWGRPDWQWCLCSWCLSGELPDRCFVVGLGPRTGRERHCRSIGGRRRWRNRSRLRRRRSRRWARTWYWRCYLGQRTFYRPVSIEFKFLLVRFTSILQFALDLLVARMTESRSASTISRDKRG